MFSGCTQNVEAQLCNGSETELVQVYKTNDDIRSRSEFCVQSWSLNLVITKDTGRVNSSYHLKKNSL